MSNQTTVKFIQSYQSAVKQIGFCVIKQSFTGSKMCIYGIIFNSCFTNDSSSSLNNASIVTKMLVDENEGDKSPFVISGNYEGICKTANIQVLK